MMFNYATSIVLAFAVSSPIASVSESHLCEGETETETNLDFFGSTVKQNDLHLGGEIRYGNIGKVRDQDVDLVVTATGYSDHKNGKRNGIGPGETGMFSIFTFLINTFASITILYLSCVSHSII